MKDWISFFKESVVLKPYGPTPAELRAVQRSWLGEGPSLRLEEARKVRQAYLLTKSPEDPIKTEDFVEDGTGASLERELLTRIFYPDSKSTLWCFVFWTLGNAGFGIPVVDEEEYAELASILSCTYNEERQSGLKVPLDTNGSNLKHYSEEHIHQKIWESVHLAEENQVKSINN